MTYQPLKHKEHFSKTMEVFELLSFMQTANFRGRASFGVRSTFKIGKGKISRKKNKRYAQVAAFTL